MESNMKRTIEFLPAYDKRDTNPRKNYGIHGVDMRWYLEGEKGTVQFVVYTNWHLPHVQEELDEGRHSNHISCHPLPADLGYHAKEPHYEGQIKMDECQFIEGGCYYDGSGLNAEWVFKLLVKEGHEAVWKHMEEYYNSVFKEQE